MGLALHRIGHDVLFWEFDPLQVAAMERDRENKKFLPGFALPEGIQITNDLRNAVADAEVCLLAVPFQTSRSVLRKIGKLKRDTLILSLMKGIEQGTLRRESEICAEELEDFSETQYAILSGPTIAPEVAAGLPTSAVVASASQATAETLQAAFSSSAMRLYSSTDVVGVELAGALKNVIALAAGVCDGMELGVNTKGALITRGLAEIIRLGETLGGSRQTFSGLSGLGDLVTTCTSPASRNRRVGEAIGRGQSPADVLAGMVMVAEGVWTARAAWDLAQKHRINMPITEAVCGILDGKNPREAVNELMNRDLKAED